LPHGQTIKSFTNPRIFPKREVMEFEYMQRAAAYILDRTCPSGGFCFYRLDEPNPHDTYFALATLELLGLPFDDNGRTVQYLCHVQQDNGAFVSLPQAFFVLLSLKMLNSQPPHDPADGIAFFADRLTASLRHQAYLSTSLLQTLYKLIMLRRTLQLDWPDEERGSVPQTLLARYQSDRSLGTLQDTWLAAAVLHDFGQFQADILRPFLRSCEHPLFGFTGIPGASLHFLEYLHAGLMFCRLIGCAPSFPEACRSSILRCQMRSGGFARTSLALPSMDNTFLAVQGMALLQP
jgi:hypothetical protein